MESVVDLLRDWDSIINFDMGCSSVNKQVIIFAFYCDILAL